MSFNIWWQKARSHPRSAPIHHGVGLAVLRQDEVPLTPEQVEIAEEMVRLEILAPGEEPGTFQLIVSQLFGEGSAYPLADSGIDSAELSWSSLSKFQARNTRRNKKVRAENQLGFEFHDWTTPKAAPIAAARVPHSSW